jgi:hypothetical protein
LIVGSALFLAGASRVVGNSLSSVIDRANLTAPSRSIRVPSIPTGACMPDFPIRKVAVLTEEIFMMAARQPKVPAGVRLAWRW